MGNMLSGSTLLTHIAQKCLVEGVADIRASGGELVKDRPDLTDDAAIFCFLQYP